jgi:hypothetical protein
LSFGFESGFGRVPENRHDFLCLQGDQQRLVVKANYFSNLSLLLKSYATDWLEMVFGVADLDLAIL